MSMKTIILLLSFLIGTNGAFAVMALPPAANTNRSVELHSEHLNAAWQNYGYLSGRTARLEHDLDRLQTWLLILSVLLGSSFVSVCLLAVRDQVAKSRIEGSTRSGALAAPGTHARQKHDSVPKLASAAVDP